MSNQMTLGAFIKALQRCNEDADVVFDFCHIKPTDFDSYRGYYEQLALGWEVDGKDMTCSQMLQLANRTVNKVFYGYKGGDYKMTVDTPLWVSNYGEAKETAIVDVVDKGYYVVIMTAYQEW